MECLKVYLKEERSKSPFQESSYLLLSQRSEKLHRDAINRWLNKVSKELGFHMNCHLFRHNFCTSLLKAGVDLTMVSKLAGHSSVSITAKYYIHQTREEKLEAVRLL